jgi:exodeoxyribonuclease VII large subunit
MTAVPPDDRVFSVSALTAAIKHTLEGSFPFVWVRGQVGNLSRPASGHVYFSLQDEFSSLAAVWFKGNQKEGEQFDPLTGEVYEDGPRPSPALRLENGQEIICAGRLALYGARGIYQLVVELARESGRGRLHEEFERLRARLAGLGYFSLERKRPLPENPARVALVTAPGGAAIHDFLRIAQGRGLSARIRVFPIPVQGENAPPKILAAMQRVFAENWAQVLVIVRGGGSADDLRAFNDEGVAAAIFTAPIPVLAGIGHEVDVTLADMTADVRAATPSHAAQLLWPAREELSRRLRLCEHGLDRAARRVLEMPRLRLAGLRRDLERASPGRMLAGWRERLASGLRLLYSAGKLGLERKSARLRARISALNAAAQGIAPGKERLALLEERLTRAGLRTLAAAEAKLDSTVRRLASVPARLPAAAAALEALDRRMKERGGQRLLDAGHRLERAALRLEALNPHAPLERGYALLRRHDGAVISSAAGILAGDALRVTVRDGDISVRVEETHVAIRKGNADEQ